MPKAKPKTVTVISVDSLPLAGPKVARKGNLELPSETGLGSMAYSDRELMPLFAQPLIKKQEKGRDTWANTALVLVMRAKKAAQTYGKKDFNSLYRLVLSAGIAFDKAWPTQVAPITGNLVVQLFGSLGPAAAKAILEPVHPIIDITPNQVDQPLGTDTEPAATAQGEPPNEIPLDSIQISDLAASLRAVRGGSTNDDNLDLAT